MFECSKVRKGKPNGHKNNENNFFAQWILDQDILCFIARREKSPIVEKVAGYCHFLDNYQAAKDCCAKDCCSLAPGVPVRPRLGSGSECATFITGTWLRKWTRRNNFLERSPSLIRGLSLRLTNPLDISSSENCCALFPRRINRVFNFSSSYRVDYILGEEFLIF